MIFWTLSTGIFLASLQSFYIARLGGPIIPYTGGLLLMVAGVAFVALRANQRLFRPQALFVAFAIAAIATVSAITTEDLRSSAGVVIGGFTFLAVLSLARGHSLELARAIRLVLIAHLCLLFIQIVWFYATGSYLDYLVFTDDNAVWKSRKGWNIGGHLVPRFTGAFNEPGSYSGVMGAMLAAYYFIKRKASALVWLVITTLIASASLTGAFLAIGMVGAIIVERYKRLDRNGKFATLLLGALLAGAAASFMGIRFIDRLQYTGGAEDAAILNLQWLLDAANITALGHSTASLPSYVSAEYFGVWMTTYIQFGVLGLAALVAMLLPAASANFAIAGILLLSKVKITFPLIFILGAVVWVKR